MNLNKLGRGCKEGWKIKSNLFFFSTWFQILTFTQTLTLVLLSVRKNKIPAFGFGKETKACSKIPTGD